MRICFIYLMMFFFGSMAFAMEPIEGKDYLKVKPTTPSSSEQIEVVDFFSYTCGHCFRLAPLVDDWEKNLPKDVKLIRSPVAWDDTSQFLAHIYFTIRALDPSGQLHMSFWQDIMNGQITSSESMDQWLIKNGVDLQKWNLLYNSFSVQLATQQATQRWQDYQIDATPYIGVAGKYLTAPHLAGSRQKTFEVLNWLIKKERTNRQKIH